ncbi:hypothetical protein Tco_1415943 [Tanacetum coccineum]
MKQSNGKDQAKAAKKGETFGKDKPLPILMVQPWEKVARQKITQFFSPESVISFPLLGEEDGTEGLMIIEAEMGGHCVHRMYVDGGSSSEILYEHCFNRFRPEVKNQMIPTATPLVGFSGEIIWPLGKISLFVKISDEEHSTSAWMNFMVVRSPSPFNGIIGRPRGGMREGVMGIKWGRGVGLGRGRGYRGDGEDAWGGEEVAGYLVGEGGCGEGCGVGWMCRKSGVGRGIWLGYPQCGGGGNWGACWEGGGGGWGMESGEGFSAVGIEWVVEGFWKGPVAGDCRNMSGFEDESLGGYWGFGVEGDLSMEEICVLVDVVDVGEELGLGGDEFGIGWGVEGGLRIRLVKRMGELEGLVGWGGRKWGVWGIIGDGPRVAIHPEYPKETIAIGSTLKEKGRKELCGLLRRNLDIFAWRPADMTGVPRHIAKNRLNIRKGCLPVRQKKMGQAPERSKAICKEVEKLVEAGIMKEVRYHSWLSNPVMVKKHDDNWRMCVDFKDLNKHAPKTAIRYQK